MSIKLEKDINYLQKKKAVIYYPNGNKYIEKKKLIMTIYKEAGSKENAN